MKNVVVLLVALGLGSLLSGWIVALDITLPA
jgi:hypothetical protein